MSNNQGQSIYALEAFPGAVLGDGSTRSLLVVTTQPAYLFPNQQGAVWVYDVCDAQADPKLLFAVSTGVGTASYAPSVDLRDGTLVVGRLTESVLVIDLVNAINGWNAGPDPNADPQVPYSPADVIHAGGVNQGAIFQPFYLSNPEGQMETHVGVALVPDTAGAATQHLNVAVGLTQGYDVKAPSPDGTLRLVRGFPTAIFEVPESCPSPQLNPCRKTTKTKPAEVPNVCVRN